MTKRTRVNVLSLEFDAEIEGDRVNERVVFTGGIIKRNRDVY